MNSHTSPDPGNSTSDDWISREPSLGLSHHFWFRILTIASLAVALETGVKAQERQPILARIDGYNITQREVDATLMSQILPLQQQIYVLRKIAVETLINRRMLENEALRRGIAVDTLKQQLMSGTFTVSTDQVEQQYQQNVSAFALLSPDEAKEKLRLDLEGQLRLRKFRDELARLRTKFRIEVLLEEPRLPSPSFSDRASIGPRSAPVVITEFSDFQCPYCKDSQRTIKRLLDAYPNDLRVDFKHLPLEIHQFAFQAAQAAYCGGKQGAFWRVHGVLFDAKDLSADLLNGLTTALDLDRVAFEACIDSEESQSAVLADVQEARRFGVTGTPSFIINGKMFRGAVSFEKLKAAIDTELQKLKQVSNQQ